MKDRSAAIIVRNGHILLLHRRKWGRESYALPGGKIEPGETPAETCRREVGEETHLTIDAGPPVASFINAGRVEHYFRARDIRGRARLGGPERERNCPGNSYRLEWIPVGRVGEVRLMPPAARRLCVELLAADPGCAAEGDSR